LPREFRLVAAGLAGFKSLRELRPVAGFTGAGGRFRADDGVSAALTEFGGCHGRLVALLLGAPLAGYIQLLVGPATVISWVGAFGDDSTVLVVRVLSLAVPTDCAPPGDHMDPAHLDESAVDALLPSLALPVAPLDGGGGDPGDHMEPAHFEESAVDDEALLVALSVALLVGGGDPADHMDPAHLEESAVETFLLVALSEALL
jgi:hypothetical protein